MTDAPTCGLWCSAISNILAPINYASALFSTVAVRDALLAVVQHATSDAACNKWCSLITCLPYNKAASYPVFGTAAVRDALVGLQPRVATAAACTMWCGAVQGLATIDEALVRVAAVRDAHAALQRVAASSAQSKWIWEQAGSTVSVARR